MDNDYIIKLGPEAFALLYCMVEEEVGNQATEHTVVWEMLSVANLPLLEVWTAIQRADKEHRCVDEGHRLLV